MGNQKHAFILQEGVEAWNRWRRENPKVIPNLEGRFIFDKDLYGINLRGARLKNLNAKKVYLEEADLRGADLTGADLYGASLWAAKCQDANFRRARLERAYLVATNFNYANLIEANLEDSDCFQAQFKHCKMTGADLRQANFTEANLDHAILPGANLGNSILVRTSFRDANLSGSDVYGASIWDVITDKKTNQTGLITDSHAHKKVRDSFEGVSVDGLNVAHFVSLIQRPEIISQLIDAASNRVVLLLGRFKGGGASLLSKLGETLRFKGYLPIVFNFPPPEERDTIETVKVLASLSRFVVVDLSQPRSVPLELHAVVPHIMVPIVPIVKNTDRAFAMFSDLRQKYFWILPPVTYKSSKELLDNVDSGIIDRANKKLTEIKKVRKGATVEPTSINNY